jgi:hypothetical protein
MENAVGTFSKSAMGYLNTVVDVDPAELLHEIINLIGLFVAVIDVA